MVSVPSETWNQEFYSGAWFMKIDLSKVEKSTFYYCLRAMSPNPGWICDHHEKNPIFSIFGSQPTKLESQKMGYFYMRTANSTICWWFGNKTNLKN